MSLSKIEIEEVELAIKREHIFPLLYIIVSENSYSVDIKLVPDLQYVDRERREYLAKNSKIEGGTGELKYFPEYEDGLTEREVNYYKAHWRLASGNSSFSSMINLFGKSDDEIKEYFSNREETKMKINLKRRLGLTSFYEFAKMQANRSSTINQNILKIALEEENPDKLRVIREETACPAVADFINKKIEILTQKKAG